MTPGNRVVDDCRSGRLRAQSAVAELYQLAALLVGDERQAAALVEAAVARTETDPCANAEASVEATRLALVSAAIAYFRQIDPGAFEAPTVGVGTGGCIEGEDFSDDGLIADPKVLREGLTRLSPAQRAIFVLRAIVRLDSVASATLLERAGCGGWGAAQVGDVFRQALCSVSSSLLQEN